MFSAKKFILPQSWYFQADGKLTSYEFLSYSKQLEAPSDSFISELFQELQALGCGNLFGIKRIGHLQFGRSWEVSPKELRLNLTRFENELPKTIDTSGMVSVVWAFSKNGQARSVSECSSSTNSIEDEVLGPLDYHQK